MLKCFCLTRDDGTFIRDFGSSCDSESTVFNQPVAMCLSNEGALFVCDIGSHSIKVVWLYVCVDVWCLVFQGIYILFIEIE